jgi:hypothetical protein
MKIDIIISSHEIDAPLTEVFDTVFDLDLLEIFRKLWYVPHFTYSYKNRNKPERPATTRQILFIDASTAKQQLVNFLPEMSFKRKIYGFSSRRFLFLKEIRYQYYFFSRAQNQTRINCCYEFEFTNILGRFIFSRIVHKTLQRHIDLFLYQLASDLKQN